MTMVPASTSPDFTIGRVLCGGTGRADPAYRRDLYPPPMLDRPGGLARNKPTSKISKT